MIPRALPLRVVIVLFFFVDQIGEPSAGEIEITVPWVASAYRIAGGFLKPQLPSRVSSTTATTSTSKRDYEEKPRLTFLYII